MKKKPASHIWLLLSLFALVLMVGCGKKEEEKQTVIEYRDAPTASVAGELSLPAGIDASGVMVYAEGTSFIAISDSEGRYEISGLKPGTYRVRSSRSDLLPAAIETFTITDADMQKPQPFRQLPRVLLDSTDPNAALAAGGFASNSLATVRGRVIAANAGDEMGVTVELEGTPFQALTLEDGSFEMIRVSPGSYTLLATRPGYDPTRAQVRVMAGQVLDVGEVPLGAGGEITLSQRNDGTIFGRVDLLLADGEIPSDFSMVRVILEGTSFSATPDRQGRYTIGNLPRAGYTVTASAPGFLVSEKVEVNLGQVPAADVALTLVEVPTDDQSLGSLVGRAYFQDAPNASGGITIAIAGTSLGAYTDAGGYYSILNVPQGQWDVIASANGYKTETLRGVTVATNNPTEVADIILKLDVIPPTVISTNPADGARDVPVDEPTRVMIRFSQPMKTDSVINAIKISPEVGFRVVPRTGGFASIAEIFDIRLDALPKAGGKALRFSTTYKVTVAKSATNQDEVGMEEDFVMSLTTGSARVLGTNPTDKARDVLVNFNQPIQIFFNAVIDHNTINPDLLEFRPPLPAGSPNVRLRSDAKTGWSVLYVSGVADLDTEYRVTLKRGPRTITGNNVQNVPYSFSFRTQKGRTTEEQYGQPATDSDALERERNRGR